MLEKINSFKYLFKRLLKEVTEGAVRMLSSRCSIVEVQQRRNGVRQCHCYAVESAVSLSSRNVMYVSACTDSAGRPGKLVACSLWFGSIIWRP